MEDGYDYRGGVAGKENGWLGEAIGNWLKSPAITIRPDGASSTSNSNSNSAIGTNVLGALSSALGQGQQAAATTPIDSVSETISMATNTVPDRVPDATDETTWLNDDTVEYTYKEGDTFGQVIKDLGLMTDNGLWGNNGDVHYYEKQLRDQGWEGGNIPIGTKIRLRKRPAVRYDIYGNRVRD